MIPLLARVREVWDGPLVLHKGPELSLDYPGPRLRRFCDLDLLTDDAAGAQAALLAAGFEEARQEERDGVVHHLCPLRWPGLPLTVELHSRPELGGRHPGADDGRADRERRSQPARRRRRRRAAARAARAGARGARVVASAAGPAREPDRRRGDAAARRRVRGAPRWRAGGDAARMWRTTRAAIGAVLEGSGRSAAVALWARHLRGVREPTVFEWHVKSALAPVWGLPGTRVPAAVVEPSPGHGRPGSRRAVAVKAAAGRAGPAERGDRPLGAHPRAGRARPYTTMEGTEAG